MAGQAMQTGASVYACRSYCRKAGWCYVRMVLRHVMCHTVELGHQTIIAVDPLMCLVYLIPTFNVS